MNEYVIATKDRQGHRREWEIKVSTPGPLEDAKRAAYRWGEDHPESSFWHVCVGLFPNKEIHIGDEPLYMARY